MKYHHVTQAEKIKLLFLSGMDQRLQDSDSRQTPAQAQVEEKLEGPKSKPDARRQRQDDACSEEKMGRKWRGRAIWSTFAFEREQTVLLRWG